MFKRSEMNKLPVRDYVLAMFEATDEKGILTFANGDDSFSMYAMDWSSEDARWLADFLDNLCEQLKKIAPLWDELGTTREENSHILSPELLDIWDTYVRMFPCEAPQWGHRYMILGSKYRTLPTEHQALAQYESYRTFVLQDSLKRLPQKATHPYFVIIRTIRYARLLFLKAPEIILRNESHRLAEAMAEYYFLKGTSKKYPFAI